MARGVVDRYGKHGHDLKTEGLASVHEATAPAADRQGNAGALSSADESSGFFRFDWKADR
jgi:hypothetical protein